MLGYGMLKVCSCHQKMIYKRGDRTNEAMYSVMAKNQIAVVLLQNGLEWNMINIEEEEV